MLSVYKQRNPRIYYPHGIILYILLNIKYAWTSLSAWNRPSTGHSLGENMYVLLATREGEPRIARYRREIEICESLAELGEKTTEWRYKKIHNCKEQCDILQ